MAKKRRSISDRVSDAAARVIDGDDYQQFQDWNHGRSDALHYERFDVSEGTGTLFDVPESNLDDGTRPSRKPEIVDPNAFRITSANIGPMIWVSLLAASIAIIFVLSIVDRIENPRPDRPYRSEPVNNDPTHPCYGLTARECKWN
jgi:hypothetical protein